jgi:CBS domain-containing protein
MKVSDLMQTEVVTLRVADTLDVAENIMNLGRIRHLPVVDADDRLVGIVTQRDLLRAAVSSVLGFDRAKEQFWLGSIRVRDVMTAEVTTIPPEAEVSEAVDKMLAGKFGCLPVVEGARLVGLITETDCLRCLRDLLKMGMVKEAPASVRERT